MSYNPNPGQPGQPFLSPEATIPLQPRKKSRRGLWISLVIVVILLIGGAATLFVVTAPSRAVTSVVQNYYAAVEQQDYATAYTYIDKHHYITATGIVLGNFTQGAYTISAEANDLANGKLTASTITSTAVNDMTAEVMVNVTRGGTLHAVDVQLQQVNGAWEIDRISSM